MKTIYLFRHGDAEENAPYHDYYRKLTARGEQQSAEMAEHLKTEMCRIDLMISSGASRAKSTAAVIAGIFGYAGQNIEIEDILYSSDKAEDIIRLIRQFPVKISSMMLVGHNPLLSDFVLYICKNSGEINMEKSSVIKIYFNTEEWNLIEPGSGEIVFYKMFSGTGIVNNPDYIH